jgi:hypothetical protein
MERHDVVEGDAASTIVPSGAETDASQHPSSSCLATRSRAKALTTVDDRMGVSAAVRREASAGKS